MFIEDRIMLEYVRNNRKFFMFLFTLCGLALIVSMGMPSMSRGGRGGPMSFTSFAGKAVATVGTQEVTVRELESDLDRKEEQFRKVFGSHMNDEKQKGYFDQLRKMQLNPDRVLDELVQRKIFFHLFEEQKLQIAKGAVRDQIEQLPYFQTNGSFDPELYRKLVPAPAEFETNLRNELKSERVMQPFAFIGPLVTPGELQIARALAKKREFELLQVPAKIFKGDVTVSDAEVDALMKDDKKNTVLQTYYNRNIRTFKAPEEVSARHILIKEENGGEAKIKGIQKDIKDGKISFQDAAKKFSEDPSNAPKGGDLGYFAKGVMDPEFEKAAYALKKPGDVSDLVKSSFGFHLIQLVDHKSPLNQTFADAKKDVAREYLKDQKKLAQVKTIVAGWLKSKRGPEAAQLKPYGLTWTKAPAWDVGQGHLGPINENDLKSTELLALTKEKPLLNKAVPLEEDLVLVRFVSEKEDPVKIEDVAYQKSVRTLDLYFSKYKKSLEQDKKITRSDVVLDEVRKQMQL